MEESNNPFAIVVLAHLKTLETRNDNNNRRVWKVRLTKELYKRGFTKTEIINLYRFIDWIMVLPEELERQFHQEIIRFEEERKMQYITTAERIGIKKGKEEGIKEGIKEGIQKGKLIGEILFAQRMLKLTIYSEEELEQKSFEDLKSILENFEVKLADREDGDNDRK